MKLSMYDLRSFIQRYMNGEREGGLGGGEGRGEEDDRCIETGLFHRANLLFGSFLGCLCALHVCNTTSNSFACNDEFAFNHSALTALMRTLSLHLLQFSLTNDEKVFWFIDWLFNRDVF